MFDNHLQLDGSMLELDKSSIIRGLGYPDEEAVSTLVLEKLPEWIELGSISAKPCAVAGFAKITTTEQLIKLETGREFAGRLLSRAMADVPEALLLVVTLGEGISELINKQKGGFDAMGLDAVASEMVEAAADRFEEIALERFCPGNRYRTLRFSPGYCDWNIKELSGLLELFDLSLVGVSLTEGGMMRPRKTIAGLTGISNHPQIDGQNPCGYCGDMDCDHRRDAER